jgi:hypothetical protein
MDYKWSIDKEHITQPKFAASRLDNVSSAVCKHQEWLGADLDNLTVVVIFNFSFFNWAFVAA